MSARLRDWQPRLAAWVMAAARTPYQPGRHDCALFVAGGIEAMTGVHRAPGLPGRYSTVQGGLKRLRKAGFEDHVDVVAHLLDEVPPAYARPGDVAVVDGDDGLPALGLVQGEMIYVLRPTGLGLVPLTDARRAFRV